MVWQSMSFEFSHNKYSIMECTYKKYLLSITLSNKLFFPMLFELTCTICYCNALCLLWKYSSSTTFVYLSILLIDVL